MFMEEKVWVE